VTRHRLLLLTSSCLLATPAFAQWDQPSIPLPANTVSYYVDKENGNDANDGLTQATAWQNITVAYPQMVAVSDPTLPAALFVEEGYYAPSTGEVDLTGLPGFRIRMEPSRFIVGRNAHTTVVSAEGTIEADGRMFEFAGSGANPFRWVDGAYLDRLTIRNTGVFNPDPKPGEPIVTDLSLPNMVGWGINGGVGGTPTDCSFEQIVTQPTLANLVIYGFHTGIRSEYAMFSLINLTVTQNDVGVLTFGNPCCTDWPILNSIATGNGIDLTNIAADFIDFCNITSDSVAAPCNALGNGSMTTTTAIDGRLAITNAQANATVTQFPEPQLEFVNSAPMLGPIQPFQIFWEEEFDFRIRWQSAVRLTGADWTSGLFAQAPILDAEGEASPASPMWSLPAGGPNPSSMGADQANVFRIEQLTRQLEFTMTGSIFAFGVFAGTSALVVAPPAQIGAGPALAVAGFQDFAFTEFSAPTVIGGFTGPLILDPATLQVGSTLLLPNINAENVFPYAIPAPFRPVMQFAIVDPVNGTLLLTEGQRVRGF